MGVNWSVRVLVVEDDADLRWVVHEALEQAGYTVAEAPDGQSALDQLVVSPHELVVVLDGRMPGMDGLPLLQRIVQAAPVIKHHAYIVITVRRQTFPMPVWCRGSTSWGSVSSRSRLHSTPWSQPSPRQQAASRKLYPSSVS